MTKKHFIELANEIRQSNATAKHNGMEQYHFNDTQINVLARFCQAQNSRFNRSRWLAYIAGKCGPNGGRIA